MGSRPIFGSLLREATPEIKTNVVASDKDYRIDIAIPGLSKEDINLEVNEATIAISYEAKKDDDTVEKNVVIDDVAVDNMEKKSCHNKITKDIYGITLTLKVI